MKTPEDEAFEDIERRQGGGFPAKRAMAADKFKDGIEWWMDTTTYGAYPNPPQWHIDTGNLVRLVPAQPAQEPVNLEAIAADKFIAAEERKVGERYGYVPKLHPSEWMDEPAQEPPSEWAGIKAILDEYGLQAVDFVADFKAALAQPAQEPKFWEMPDGKIVNKWGLQFYNGVVGVALYTTPPQRPWVGLTDEDRKAVLLTAYKEWECEEFLLCAREDYLLIEQALKEKNT
jgi:hypothetical protein